MKTTHKKSSRTIPGNFTIAAMMTLLALATTSVHADNAGNSVVESPIFTIGVPDGYARELKTFANDNTKRVSGRRSPEFAAFTANFATEFVYEVGKNKSSDWPFVQDDKMSLAISFDLKDAPQQDLYFKIGTIDSWSLNSTGQPLPPVVVVKVNDTALEEQSVTESCGGSIVYHPDSWGANQTLVWRVSGDKFKPGNNQINIAVKMPAKWGSAHVIYDYLSLDTNPAKPEIPDRRAEWKASVLAGALKDVKEIVFASRYTSNSWNAHFYENVGDKTSSKKGRLCKYDIHAGKLTVLLEDPKGGIRDPYVDYDGKKILFARRKPFDGRYSYHRICEINADGTGLRQITPDFPYDDIEPVYLPDGDILFSSGRGRRAQPCWGATPATILARCDRNGKNFRLISANMDFELTPWPMPDGRVLYMRWEYVDRSQVDFHHLWTSNPDGTGQMAYFGNMNPGGAFLDAKPIPGSDRIVMVNGPGHGNGEHRGCIETLSQKKGPDDESVIRQITPVLGYRDPYPFSEELFMAAYERQILLMDGIGRTAVLYQLPDSVPNDVTLHEPRPLVPHPREAVIPSRVNPDAKDGRLVMQDVYVGRNMAGLKRGTIKNLLVLEVMPKPANFDPTMEPITLGGTFMLERIIGTVPVEDDGSASFKLPANRAFYFVAMDEHDNAVKRMHSFTSVMPGEVSSCVGCHENRTTAPPTGAAGAIIALGKPPAVAEPLQDIPEIIDFPRDIQPLLNNNCVKCHDNLKPSGGIVLNGDHGPVYSLAYYNLTAEKQFTDGRNRPRGNYAPYEIGSANSELIAKCSGGHHDVKVSDKELRLLKAWIHSGAAYSGTYAALGSGCLGRYEDDKRLKSDSAWQKLSEAGNGAFEKRCVQCHKEIKRPLPMLPISGYAEYKAINDGPRNDPAARFSANRLYDLSKPAESRILLAPLATAAGGLAGGKFIKHDVIFKSADDPDYKAILAMVEYAGKELEKIKRFDMPGFKPCAGYVSEMKRHGVIPLDFNIDKDTLNVYEVDKRYFDLSTQWRDAAVKCEPDKKASAK